MNKIAIIWLILLTLGLFSCRSGNISNPGNNSSTDGDNLDAGDSHKTDDGFSGPTDGDSGAEDDGPRVESACVVNGPILPTDGPEILISPNGVASQSEPAAAFDDDDSYLVVWSDGSGLWGGDSNICGVRLSAEGTVLDSPPIIISAAPDFQKRPRVSWNGSHWLVIWQDMRNGDDYDIYGARVGHDGSVLDPEGLPVATGQGDQVLAELANHGSDFLVVWSDYRNGNYDIYGSLVRDQKIEPATGLILQEGEQMAPCVVWTGEHYLVACANANHEFPGVKSFMTIQVDEMGIPSNDQPKFHGFGITAFDSVMAFADGHALLVGRSQSGKLYNPNMFFAVFLDPNGEAVASNNPGREMFKVPLGVVQDPAPIPLSNPGYDGALDVFSSSVAQSGQWFLTLHQETQGGNAGGASAVPVIRRQLICAADGQVLVDDVLTPAGTREKSPFAAGGPDGTFLVVYERNRKTDTTLRVCARLVAAQ